MHRDVEEMVSRCEICQRNKYLAMSPGGLLQPLALPGRVWEEISMDFIDGLPRSEGFTVILVVVDRLSKYAHFIPLRHPYTAVTVAAVFIREIVRLHGVPEAIVSDRDKVFLSHFWKELFRLQGTVLKRSTAYHPQTDGQTEVVNRSLETYLRCFASETPKLWAKWLSWAEYWYNTSFHSASQMTPFKVLYGREPPHLVHFGSSSMPVFAVEEYLEERDKTLEELKRHLLRARQIMKKQADGHRKDIQFEVGEKVYLKLCPYRQKTVANRRNEKLAPRYFGPYEVLAKIGAVAYRLQLPPTATIHPVFHVSQLRRAIGDYATSTNLPGTLTEEMEIILEPLELMEVRQKADGATEVLIKWKNLPDYEATWEPYERMKRQFPDFHFEDKVVLWEGGNVRPVLFGPVQPAQSIGPARFVYRRKEKADRLTPRINGKIPDINNATLDHERLSERLATYGLAELRVEGDGNCQFRALADQLFRNPDYHKHVRKEVVKQLKHFQKLYESYVPMDYKTYLKYMKRSGEWGDHVTLQATADRFAAKICLLTSFKDNCLIEIVPKEKSPSKELWLSFWSEVHYNSLYGTDDLPGRITKRKHWLF
ncbi:hypothetical protein KFK09_021919 [Dendrobium nobile]|uniref:ubiquitinyl hydrolase 1 n=1 Tax=Dendrobium nobile TaxID=94219 RepID=A0A8T3AGB2_DENNO|nr:hypothetical protein KFK09_021919 [Dendrobium nobile]